MFSAYQEPSQSEERITFPFSTEKDIFDRSFYNPSLTTNQLSTEEVDDTLGQIDKIYRDRGDDVLRTIFFGVFGCLAFQRGAYRWHPYAYQVAKPFYLGANALIFAATGLYIWRHNKKAKNKTGKLLEQANQRILPKGFRWYFPQNLSKIELYPDNTYDANQFSDNDDCKETFSQCPEACLDEL